MFIHEIQTLASHISEFIALQTVSCGPHGPKSSGQVENSQHQKGKVRKKQGHQL